MQSNVAELQPAPSGKKSYYEMGKIENLDARSLFKLPLSALRIEGLRASGLFEIFVPSPSPANDRRARESVRPGIARRGIQQTPETTLPAIQGPSSFFHCFGLRNVCEALIGT